MNRIQLLLKDICVENEYFYKYCNLIECNINTVHKKFETQKHHIIPKAYFKHNNIEIDNTLENIVVLSHRDHILAHYYLSKCCVDDYLIYSNEYALLFMLNKQHIPEEDELFDLLDDYVSVYKDFCVRQSNLMLGHTPWNKGVKMPPDFCQKLRMYNLGRKHSETERYKISCSLKGKNKGGVYVNNGVVVKHIKEQDLQTYLDNGYKRGNLYSYDNKWNMRKTIHKNNVEKRVFTEELDRYQADGWELGRCKESLNKMSSGRKGKPAWNKGKKMSEEHRRNTSLHHHDWRGTVFVCNESECKRITAEELDNYLNNGYIRGMKWKAQ